MLFATDTTSADADYDNGVVALAVRLDTEGPMSVRLIV